MASLAGDLIFNGIAMDNNESENDDIWCNDFMKDQIIHSQGTIIFFLSLVLVI